MTSHTTVCAGIDTGKHKPDMAIAEQNRQLQVDNTPDGHARLAAWLVRHRVGRVGIEPRGGDEAAVVAALRLDGFFVVLLQPGQVRAFARFRLQRAKNDRIDAALIASSTTALETIHAPPDPRLTAAGAAPDPIEQIGEHIARIKSRRESCRDDHIRRHWDAEIARLKAACKAELTALASAIQQHRDLARRWSPACPASVSRPPSPSCCACRRSAASAANRPQRWPDWRPMTTTAAGIAASAISAAAASGCGALPIPRPARPPSAGTRMALYQHLTAQGKSHKLALVACARKLIIYANTVAAPGNAMARGDPISCYPSVSLFNHRDRFFVPTRLSRDDRRAAAVKAGRRPGAATNPTPPPGHALTAASTSSSSNRTCY